MRKKILFLCDMEGLLISNKAPEIEGRKYMVASRTKNEKKYITQDNISKLKELNEKVDIVPMTKLSAKQCNSVVLCVNTPMALVEGGAVLMNGTKPDSKWRYNTMETTFDDDDILRKGQKFLSEKGYEKNSDGEFTLDYVNKERDTESDVKELADLIGDTFKVLNLGNGRIWVYNKKLSRRAMVQKFIDEHDYELVISAAAPNTGWLPETGETISTSESNAKYTYDLDKEKEDPHAFASFVLDKALEIIK